MLGDKLDKALPRGGLEVFWLKQIHQEWTWRTLGPFPLAPGALRFKEDTFSTVSMQLYLACSQWMTVFFLASCHHWASFLGCVGSASQRLL